MILLLTAIIFSQITYTHVCLEMKNSGGGDKASRRRGGQLIPTADVVTRQQRAMRHA